MLFMRRLNPKTNKPYVWGHIREDGFVFDGYRLKVITTKGNYKEVWRHPIKFQKHKLYGKIKKRQFYDKISNLLNSVKLSKGCQRCGYKDSPYALEFHHKDRANKIKNVSSFHRTSWLQLEKIILEVKKCDILCSNCHKILTQKNFKHAPREEILERN